MEVDRWVFKKIMINSPKVQFLYLKLMQNKEIGNGER